MGFIESKLSDAAVSRGLLYFKARYPGIMSVQLVHDLRNEREVDGISIVGAGAWLAGLSA